MSESFGINNVAGDATDGSLKFGRHVLPQPSRPDVLGRLAPRETFTSQAKGVRPII